MEGKDFRRFGSQVNFDTVAILFELGGNVLQGVMNHEHSLQPAVHQWAAVPHLPEGREPPWPHQQRDREPQVWRGVEAFRNLSGLRGQAEGVKQHQEGGKHHQNQNRGTDQPERDGNGHRDQEFGLEGLFQHQGKKTEHGGQGCEQNGAQPAAAGRQQRLDRFDAHRHIAVE